MEENWTEKMWATSRDRIAETYRRASSLDIEAFLKTSVIGNVGKDVFNHARRKYDSKGLEKHLRLRQFVTRLRMGRLGRLGYLLLVFAVLGTLAVPLMFQAILPQQVDQEFERVMTTRENKERGVDETFNRKINFAQEKYLIYEEGKNTLKMSGYKPESFAGSSDEKKNGKDNISSQGKTTGVLTSEDVESPDPVQQWRNSDQLERELSEAQVIASSRKSEITVSEKRPGRQQKETLSKPSRSRRNKPKRRNVVEEGFRHADERSGAGSSDEENEHRGKLDPHETTSSAATVSSNNNRLGQEESLTLAPPGAHSTVGTEGSSNGFHEAFEEVLKLASEANQTAGENSVQLQEESSVKEVLPTEKSSELDAHALEGVDVALQKFSKEQDQSFENKDTVASVVLTSKEHKSDKSVAEDNDTSREVSDATPQTNSTSFGNEGATEILKLDTLRDSGKSKNGDLLGKKGKLPVDQLGTSTTSTGSDVTATAGDVKANFSDLRQEDVGSSNDSMIATSEHMVQRNDAKVNLVDKSVEAVINLKNSSTPGGRVTVNASDINNNYTQVKDGDDAKLSGVMDGGKLDESVVEEQELQVEVLKENSDDWPQESALISSLRRRAASGILRVGLFNMEATDFLRWQFLAGERPIIFPFERVNETVGWNQLYPEWIDEEERYGTPNCPSVPMPMVKSEVQLDVVIARAPCTASSALQEGWRQPSSLQVLLGAASLAVKAGNESIYVLILSDCRPLVNLFSCGELLEHRDQGWLYQVNLEQLKKRISMPVGSCQLSIPLQGQEPPLDLGSSNSQKDAYATILHSGSDYVCGAIATALGIRKTGSTKDLVILVDNSISSEQRLALEEAGWKVRDLERIYKSSTVGGKQYEKDFSKFRLWQLTDYNKVIYVEADVLVLRNLDHLFRMPEVSASGSTKTLFNSGVMVIEPSNCTFQLLMDEMQKIVSEIGGDWDFFNRIFPWWHRIPRHMNYLKYFWTRSRTNEVDYTTRLFSSDPPHLYAIHYWGYKPWQCFRDYDCNWNFNEQFASDEAHAQWFKVYDKMPENLQKQCALSTGTKAYLEHNRRVAEAAALPDRHWAINITDPRLNVCQENHCDWKSLLSYWDKTVNTTVVVASTR